MKTIQKKERLLAPGAQAPHFSLKATPDQTVSLKDFAGRSLVLVFYPADWSPVCGDELDIFNEALPDIQRFDTTLIGISTDNVWCHIAYAKERKIKFPLLSDFEPKGKVGRLYGAYETNAGVCSRAIFLIDGNGVVRWSYQSPIGINPGVEGVLQAIEELQSQNAKKKEAA
jgi:peroxiredoxin (alkyl hydroperoxide reductase subunit C)